MGTQVTAVTLTGVRNAPTPATLFPMTNPELAELLDRLMDMACPIISHLAGGRDSNQQPLPGLQDRMDAIPEKFRELVGWFEAIHRKP